jgi:cobalt/nickel transport system permease protein
MDIRNRISEIYSLEQLSAGNTVIHRLHPGAKLFGAFVFIAAVISFDRHDFGGLIPFIFYPAILMPLSNTPFAMPHKRVLTVLPFCLFIGISNLLLEREPAFTVLNVAVSGGLLSFCVILFRAYLCVIAVLLLIAATPFTDLTAQLRKLRIPEIFIIMFEMTYRYIAVLFSEAASMRTAYALRGAGKKGVGIGHAGTFIGSLLLRSIDRAERIYSAMQCRGYALGKSRKIKRKLKTADVVYCVIICSMCLFFRFFAIGKR